MSNSFVRLSAADLDKKIDAELIQLEGLDIYRLRVTNASANKALRMETVGNFTYIGQAAAGSDELDSVWQIKRLEASGAQVKITWAGGEGQAIYAWTDRESLTYS